MNKRRIVFCLLVLILIAMSTPMLVEACKTPEKNLYDLDLFVSAKNTGYSKTGLNVTVGTVITLSATLTQITERYVHVWVSKTKSVINAWITFYSCTKTGHIIKELGLSKTKQGGRAGVATFQVTIKQAGDFWFIAKFTSEDGKEHSGQGHP